MNYKKIIIILIYISLILYLFALFNISKYAPKYLSILETILKIVIGLILIIRYNPIHKIPFKFTNFDQKLLFTAGIYILLSTTFFQYLKLNLEKKLTNLIL